MTETHEQDLPEPDDTPLAPDESEAADAEEAAQYEAEGGELPTPDAEPEPEPEQSSADDIEWEARFRKIEQSFSTYSRAVERNLADDATDFIRCPLCLGATPGFVNRHAAGRIPAEQADVVKKFLGLARPVDYPASSQHRQCDSCKGLGKVATGSQVPGKEIIMCGVCSGNGFTGPEPRVPAAATNGSDGVTGPTVYAEPTEPPDYDEWQQPRLLPSGHDNPNFGRMPNHWIKVEPWGDTRGLTAQDAVGGS
jgi:hypothetical protein